MVRWGVMVVVVSGKWEDSLKRFPNGQARQKASMRGRKLLDGSERCKQCWGFFKKLVVMSLQS